jgi:subtilisin-like proprotein convertase family protein
VTAGGTSTLTVSTSSTTPAGSYPVTVTGTSSANTHTPSTTSTVEVHIVHTYVGDLVVSLVAPDGTVYTLRSRTGGSADNIDATFTANLSSETANGTWRLRVQDAASLDTGYINSWTLSL